MTNEQNPKDYLYSSDFIMHKDTAQELKITNLEDFVNKSYSKLFRKGYLLVMSGYIFGKSRKCIIVNPNLKSKKKYKEFQTFTKAEIQAFNESL